MGKNTNHEKYEICVLIYNLFKQAHTTITAYKNLHTCRPNPPINYERVRFWFIEYKAGNKDFCDSYYFGRSAELNY